MSDAQKEAVVDFSHNLLVVSCAGSGKTSVVTRKVAYAIGALGYKRESILALTFTKDAANEMKERAAVRCPVEGVLHLCTTSC